MIQDLKKSVLLLRGSGTDEIASVIEEAIRAFDDGYLLEGLGRCSKALELFDSVEQTPTTVAAREMILNVFADAF